MLSCVVDPHLCLKTLYFILLCCYKEAFPRHDSGFSSTDKFMGTSTLSCGVSCLSIQ